MAYEASLPLPLLGELLFPRQLQRPQPHREPALAPTPAPLQHLAEEKGFPGVRVKRMIKDVITRLVSPTIGLIDETSSMLGRASMLSDEGIGHALTKFVDVSRAGELSKGVADQHHSLTPSLGTGKWCGGESR